MLYELTATALFIYTIFILIPVVWIVPKKVLPAKIYNYAEVATMIPAHKIPCLYEVHQLWRLSMMLTMVLNTRVKYYFSVKDSMLNFITDAK